MELTLKIVDWDEIRNSTQPAPSRGLASVPIDKLKSYESKGPASQGPAEERKGGKIKAKPEPRPNARTLSHCPEHCVEALLASG